MVTLEGLEESHLGQRQNQTRASRIRGGIRRGILCDWVGGRKDVEGGEEKRDEGKQVS